MTFLGSKYQSCRIFSVSHGQGLALDADGTVRNGGADLQHMGFQNTFLALDQIVGVILQHGSTLGILFACGHDLHQTYHGGYLPVTFCAEAVALLHQSLNGQSGQLLQRTQISEVGNDGLIFLLFQETFKSQFDLCLYSHMFFKLFGVSSL